MRLHPNKLLPASHHIYYLYGEDGDALSEAAEALLADGSNDALRLRLDIGELARIEEESRNGGLFGPAYCYALVRNAQSATPKQSSHLLQLIDQLDSSHRLIICAPGIEWKKALHKKLQALTSLPQCEFRLPDESGFRRWLQHQLAASELQVTDEASAWMSERLCGMRMAARQMIERLCWYDHGEGHEIGIDIVAELLGERAPDDLAAWCHAVAMRRPEAISLAARLLREQQMAEVQMIAWLGTRMQQLLIYCWFQAQRDRNPLAAARVFGEARKLVPAESRNWNSASLTAAMNSIIAAEKLVKGASIEDKQMVVERLTRDLVQPAA